MAWTWKTRDWSPRGDEMLKNKAFPRTDIFLPMRCKFYNSGLHRVGGVR